MGKKVMKNGAPKISKKLEKELIAKFGHVPTQEEIFAKIKESQERMIKALEGAWETAPDDPKEREQLAQVVGRAGRLREKIYDLIGERPPKIPPSSKKPLRG